ncbi:hypothetical protein G3S63_002290 [Escherichia coli]|nr:hypothetical protein [Escherichia coli]
MPWNIRKTGSYVKSRRKNSQSLQPPLKIGFSACLLISRTDFNDSNQKSPFSVPGDRIKSIHWNNFLYFHISHGYIFLNIPV